MSTLREIAEHAGVSVATASMAVRDHDSISLETKRKVWEAQEKLGYRTRLKPRRLSNVKGSKEVKVATIAFLLIDRDFDDPAYSLGFHGVAKRVAQYDWRCLYLHARMEDLQRGVLPSALNKDEVDGIIVGGVYDAATHKMLCALGIPIVVFGNYDLGDEPWSSCEIDVAQGMCLLVRRLKALGHRRFSLITRTSLTRFHQQQLQFYLFEMSKDGLENAGTILVDDNVSIREASRRLLESPGRPDVVILGSATFAPDVYDACAELNLRIPEDVSIVAFSKGLHIMKPALATVQVEPHEYGSRCLDKLAALMAEPESLPTKECFMMQFVPGGSISQLPDG